MINLDAINKKNVIKEPFEYMCIDFIDRDSMNLNKLINQKQNLMNLN